MLRLPALLAVLAAVAVVVGVSSSRAQVKPTTSAQLDRSPVDLVLTQDERWLLTANQTSSSVSLVNLTTGKVVAEVPCSQKPGAIALTPDQKTVLVTGTWGGELNFFDLQAGNLTPRHSIYLGFEPRGIAVSPEGQTAYVGLGTGNAVAVVDLVAGKELERIAVGRWPRYLALSPDGKKLAVGASGDGGVCVLDLPEKKVAFQENFWGLNQGQMQISKDGKYAYVPWIGYMHNPISSNNIRLGWVTANRIARVKLGEKARREALSLDPQGKAVGDPHGLALSPDEETLVCAASGTHELLVYRARDLPWVDFGAPDHIHPDLLHDQERFARIDLGGRPMFVRWSQDGKRVFVANYLLNCVQVVDVPGRKIVRTLQLGGPAEASLARQGEAIFHDARRSLDQWYSCHTCHYEGHVNALAMDTRNDGSIYTFKTVLSLRNVTHTGPWTWHGWQKELEPAIEKSMIDTMLGPTPTKKDVAAMRAFFETLTTPPNPHRHRDGSLNPAAQRGEKVFWGEKAGCANCHHGKFFTDGQIHDVGLGSRSDRYQGYNTPSLRGIYDRVLYLHDGRARTLEETLRGPHNPNRVTRKGDLTEQELQDLLEYVRSL